MTTGPGVLPSQGSSNGPPEGQVPITGNEAGGTERTVTPPGATTNRNVFSGINISDRSISFSSPITHRVHPTRINSRTVLRGGRPQVRSASHGVNRDAIGNLFGSNQRIGGNSFLGGNSTPSIQYDSPPALSNSAERIPQGTRIPDGQYPTFEEYTAFVRAMAQKPQDVSTNTPANDHQEPQEADQQGPQVANVSDVNNSDEQMNLQNNATEETKHEGDQQPTEHEEFVEGFTVDSNASDSSSLNLDQISNSVNNPESNPPQAATGNVMDLSGIPHADSGSPNKNGT